MAASPRAPSWLQLNLGLVAFALVLPPLVSYLFKLGLFQAEKFVWLSYAVKVTSANVGTIKSTSDGRPVHVGDTVYTAGLNDIYFVGYWILVLMSLRHFASSFIIKPLARAIMRRKNEMNVHKVAENFWLFLWYLCAWLAGLAIQYGSVWWFGGATMLGGRADWSSHLWIGYPYIYHTATMKLYYLLEGAFWTSLILVTLIEPWRSDTIQMIVHHIVTAFLVTTSYSYNEVRIGTAIMVCQDLADIFLPLAKTFRYLGFPGMGNVCFAIFTFIWFPTRHYLLLFLAYSIFYEYPVIIDNSRWEPAIGYYGHWLIHPVYSGLMVVLQGLMIFWAVEIVRALVRALVAGEVTDHRSGSESDEQKKPRKPKDKEKEKVKKQD